MSGIVPNFFKGLLGQVAKKFRNYDTPLKGEVAHRPAFISDEEHALLVDREGYTNDRQFAKDFAAKNGLVVNEPRFYGLKPFDLQDKRKAAQAFIASQSGATTVKDILKILGQERNGAAIPKFLVTNRDRGLDNLPDTILDNIGQFMYDIAQGQARSNASGATPMDTLNNPVAARLAAQDELSPQQKATLRSGGDNAISVRMQRVPFGLSYGVKAGMLETWQDVAAGKLTLDDVLTHMAGNNRTDNNMRQYGPRMASMVKAIEGGKTSTLGSYLGEFDKRPDGEAIKQTILDATRANAQRIADDKTVGKLNDKFEKLGDSIDTAKKHMGDFSDVMKRATDTTKPLTQEEAIRQKANFGLMDSLANARGSDPNQRMAFETALANRGYSGSQIAALNAQLNQYQGMQQGEWDSLLSTGTTGSAEKARGGIGQRAFHGLLSGDLGNLGWTMFNAQRLWRLTGGGVTDRLAGYAQYSMEQQASSAGMGLTNQFSGAGLDVVRARNNLSDFGLANQRAAWNTYGGLQLELQV